MSKYISFVHQENWKVGQELHRVTVLKKRRISEKPEKSDKGLLDRNGDYKRNTLTTKNGLIIFFY